MRRYSYASWSHRKFSAAILHRQRWYLLSLRQTPHHLNSTQFILFRFCIAFFTFFISVSVCNSKPCAMCVYLTCVCVHSNPFSTLGLIYSQINLAAVAHDHVLYNAGCASTYLGAIYRPILCHQSEGSTLSRRKCAISGCVNMFQQSHLPAGRHQLCPRVVSNPKSKTNSILIVSFLRQKNDPSDRELNYYVDQLKYLGKLYFLGSVSSDIEEYLNFQAFLDLFGTWNNETFFNTRRIMIMASF